MMNRASIYHLWTFACLVAMFIDKTVWWSISVALFAIAAILDDIRDIERNHKCS